MKHPTPWKFGITKYNDDCEEEFKEYPLDYEAIGYYDNPSIFDANGEEIVGCTEYMVFNTLSARARLINTGRMLNFILTLPIFEDTGLEKERLAIITSCLKYDYVENKLE